MKMKLNKFISIIIILFIAILFFKILGKRCTDDEKNNDIQENFNSDEIFDAYLYSIGEYVDDEEDF